MIIYIAIALFLILYTMIYDVNKNSKRKKVFLCISFGLLTIIAALRKYTIGTDLKIIYKPIFENINYIQNVNIEIGFVYILKALSLLSSNIQIVTVATSIFIYFSYARFIYKNSDDVGLSTILFLLLSTFFMSMNIIRQQVAIALILYFFEWLKNKRYFKFIFIVVLASTIHSSALISIILIPFSKIKFKKQYFIYVFVIIALLLVFIVPIVDNFSDLLSIGSANKDYATYLANKKHGIGYINASSISDFLVALYLYILGMYYFVLIKKSNCDFCERENNLMLFSMSLYLFFVTSTFKMNVLSRLGYYFVPIVLITIPKALNRSSIKDNKKIIIYTTELILFIKYLLVVCILADTLYGVTPYKFYWQ